MNHFTASRALLSILAVLCVTAGCGPDTLHDGQDSTSGTAHQAVTTVALHRAVIDGANLSITYSKGFATCAHLLNASSQITHQNNFFCDSGDTVTITQPLSSFTGLSAGSQVKLCDGNNYNTCSNLVTVENASVTLHRAAIEGSNLRITYSKNFDTCAHLVKSNYQMTHQSNFICTTGSNLSILQPLSAFTGISAGTQVKLCHGNNYGICSSLVAVQ